MDWPQLSDCLGPILEGCGAAAVDGRILHVGCGNSALGVDMRQAGFGGGGVVNTDIAPTVVAQMRQRFPEDIWEVDDALNMAYARAAPRFNAVVDKGTLDAFACSEGAQVSRGRARSRPTPIPTPTPTPTSIPTATTT